MRHCKESSAMSCEHIGARAMTAAMVPAREIAPAAAWECLVRESVIGSRMQVPGSCLTLAMLEELFSASERALER